LWTKISKKICAKNLTTIQHVLKDFVVSLLLGFFLISNNIQNAIIGSNIHNNSGGGPKMDPIFKKVPKVSHQIYFCFEKRLPMLEYVHNFI